MSIEYVRAVFELDQPSGLARLLLLCIAEHANSHGYAEPGNECLARETKISVRQVQRLISTLEYHGLLTIIRPGNGRGHPRLLRLAFAPATLSKRVTTPAPSDDSEFRKGDTEPQERVTPPAPPTDPEPVKGDNEVSERVTTDALKGDNASTPTPLKGDKRVTTDTGKGDNGAGKGDTLPEKTPDNPNYNPNYKPLTAGGDLGRTRAAGPAPELAEGADRVTAPPRPAVLVQSPYLKDPRKFKGGYIPAGQGVNPVEVWYESFSINDQRWRLSAPLEDDLARHCPDLDRLRQVCQAYRQHGHYAPRNLKLTFDWYDQGIPNRSQQSKAERKAQHDPDYDFSSYQPQLVGNSLPA